MLERSCVSARAAKPDNAENLCASIVKSLPAKIAEEARHESVRIIRDCSRPRDNLTGAERKMLRALRTNTDSPSSQQLRTMTQWYSTLLTMVRRLVPFYRTQLTEVGEGSHRDGRMQNHTSS